MPVALLPEEADLHMHAAAQRRVTRLIQCQANHYSSLVPTLCVVTKVHCVASQGCA